jgi:hypothetical protein
MALNFPSSPTVGQVYTDSVSGFSYEWNGTVWISFSAASSSQIKPLDDISGSFDDVTQTFALTSNSVSIIPPTSQSLIINLGGVIQDATDDYSVTSSNITFSTPPASGLSFSGVSLGPAIPINTILDGTVTDGSLRISTTAVVGSATTFTEDLVVSGDARVTGILTVGTSSITLNGSTNNIQTGSINNGPLAGFRNRIINGDMRIDQRNNGASVTPTVNGTYVLDRWLCVLTQASKYSVQRNAGGVTPPAGFTNYLGVTSLSAYSLLSSDLFWVDQRIEGFNAADLAWGTASAKTVTLSFWVRSSLTGTFGGNLNNDKVSARSYPYTYTITSANTWEYKTIQIPGDTTGTWGSDNTTGILVAFGLGWGSTYNGTANTWAATTTLPTGATSIVGTNGATFYITGVQLEPGPVATPFEQRPIGTELALCQRYYYQPGSAYTVQSYGSGAGANTTTQIYFPTHMRTNPIITAAWSGGVNAAASTISALGANGATATLTSTTNGDFAAVITWTSFNAEL